MHLRTRTWDKIGPKFPDVPAGRGRGHQTQEGGGALTGHHGARRAGAHASLHLGVTAANSAPLPTVRLQDR